MSCPQSELPRQEFQPALPVAPALVMSVLCVPLLLAACGASPTDENNAGNSATTLDPSGTMSSASAMQTADGTQQQLANTGQAMATASQTTTTAPIAEAMTGVNAMQPMAPQGASTAQDTQSNAGSTMVAETGGAPNAPDQAQGQAFLGQTMMGQQQAAPEAMAGAGGMDTGMMVDGVAGSPAMPDTMNSPDGGAANPTDSECEFSGHVKYQFSGAETWPQDVVDLLTEAMDQATYYYNCYADLSQNLTIKYNEGVPTAEGNVDGQISFGKDRGYMQVATAMHEISHSLGVGYYPWQELITDGRWTGAAVVEFMMNLPPEQKDPDMYSQRDYITCDSQHFWPYGLNQASEYQSEWSLINNVRIVAAMHVDKQNYMNGQ